MSEVLASGPFRRALFRDVSAAHTFFYELLNADLIRSENITWTHNLVYTMALCCRRQFLMHSVADDLPSSDRTNSIRKHLYFVTKKNKNKYQSGKKSGGSDTRNWIQPIGSVLSLRRFIFNFSVLLNFSTPPFAERAYRVPPAISQIVLFRTMFFRQIYKL